MRVSVIVSTYNWPEALGAVLASLSGQTYGDFEIVVADDGSDAPTQQLVAAWRDRLPVPVKHFWQADEGYRLARSRNGAVTLSDGEFLIFIDGDCLALPGLVAGHVRHASRGWFNTGRRLFMRRRPSAVVQARGLAVHRWPRAALLALALGGAATRPLQLLRLPVSRRYRERRAGDWRQAQTCNLGVRRDDFVAVGGFDERYVGHGFEDSDFAVRLLRSGVRRLALEYTDPVLHLYHPRGQYPSPRNRGHFRDLLATPDAIRARVSLLDEWAVARQAGGRTLSSGAGADP